MKGHGTVFAWEFHYTKDQILRLCGFYLANCSDSTHAVSKAVTSLQNGICTQNTLFWIEMAESIQAIHRGDKSGWRASEETEKWIRKGLQQKK